MTWIIGISIALILLISLFVFPRQIGIVVLAAVVIAAAIFAYIQREASLRQRGIETVTGTAQIDPIACPDTENPILITLHNGSQQTVSNISFTLQASRFGPSQVRYTTRATSDQIVQPGDSYSDCWPIRPPRPAGFNPLEMEWSIAIRQVEFGR